MRPVVHRGDNVHPPVRLPALLREQRRRDLPSRSASRLSLSEPRVGRGLQGSQVSSRDWRVALSQAMSVTAERGAVHARLKYRLISLYGHEI